MPLRKQMLEAIEEEWEVEMIIFSQHELKKKGKKRKDESNSEEDNNGERMKTSEEDIFSDAEMKMDEDKANGTDQDKNKIEEKSATVKDTN